MKHIVRNLFIMLTVLLASLSTYASDFIVDGIYYNIISTDDLTVEVTTNPNNYQGDIVVPENVTYDGTTYSVISIANNAFNGSSALTSVSIPNSIGTIGEYAFQKCSSLKSVTIPINVTSVGNGAFQECNALECLTFNAKQCGYFGIYNCSAFGSSNIKEVTIGNEVECIPRWMFWGCSGITKIKLPESLTYIGDAAFAYCSGLSSVEIPSKVTYICYMAFNGCSGSKSITLPESLTGMGEIAFGECTGLKSVQCLAKNVPSAYNAFGECDLTNVILTVPSSALKDYTSTSPWNSFGYVSANTEVFFDKVIVGDMNSDNELTTEDINILSERMLGKGGKIVIPNHNEIVVGDMNNDDKLSIEDITILTETSLNRIPQHTINIELTTHDYVDLGLSDGTKWATTNIGADSQEQFGDYFAWGETSSKLRYEWNTYFDSVNGSSSNFNKYATDKKQELDKEEDAAYVNWGQNWRMPSYAQTLTLMNETYHEWTWNFNNTGRGGIIFYKAKNTDDKGKWDNPSASYTLEDTYIFIPAAGFCYPYTLNWAGSSGYLWTRTLHPDNSERAYGIHFYAGGYGDDYKERFCGHSIRPVYPLITVEVPTTTNSTLTYTADEQTWTPANWEDIKNYCTISGNTGTNAGNYTATFNLNDKDNCVWSDGSIDDKAITWTIIKKNTDAYGHEYVDLGLPSGTLWAACNIGASVPEEYGNFYQWGGTTDINNTATNLSWLNTPYQTNSSASTNTETTWSKYVGSTTSSYKDSNATDNDALLTTLSLGNDAAYVNWGSNWCMPTLDQIQELYNDVYTTVEWTTHNGVTGDLIKSNVNGNTIFIPASGLREGNELNRTGASGYFWSSSLRTGIPYEAYYIHFYNGDFYTSSAARYNGLNVRPIIYNRLTGIDISYGTIKINKGDTQTLTVSTTPVNAQYQTVTWSSSDDNVATVSSDGVVTGIGIGTATITATAQDDSGVTASCTVNVVSQLVTSITLSNSSLSINVGEESSITAIIVPSNADNKALTWTSSNTNVATVNNGVVTAVSAGSATIICIAQDGSGVSATCDISVTSSTTDSNLLPGRFSVSATKQVQFTKSNLYWDGSEFRFEENQTDYPTTWSKTHVGHFSWTNITDYQSSTPSYMPYAEIYSYSSRSTKDEFWCGEENPLCVEGTSGLYALTGGSEYALTGGNWYYLINSRTNASKLCKYGVTVDGETNCVIIAPDDFTGTLRSSYTLEEVNSLGLVCLPAAGYRLSSSLSHGGSVGNYWAATPGSMHLYESFDLFFNSSSIDPVNPDSRNVGLSLRLVCSCSDAP